MLPGAVATPQYADKQYGVPGPGYQVPGFNMAGSAGRRASTQGRVGHLGRCAEGGPGREVRWGNE